MNKNTHTESQHLLSEICSVVSELETAVQIEAFLSELLTQSELEDITKRWKILKMLRDKKPQRYIAQELSVSLCKVTRGAKILKNNHSTIRELLFDESWRS